MPTTNLEHRLTRGLLLLVLLSAFSFGAIVRTALANHYHVTCVGHGFVHGSDTNDGSFFSRVETGCGSTYRHCALYTNGSYDGEADTSDTTTTCNAWSESFGNYSECASYAEVYDPGVFSQHDHLAHNWCG